ncbi:MAG: hypothetical protein U5L45_03115 [Saprospiraceae bacterium]|nr:hypothetical protein [Saprospiraceae bacterium]
MSKDKTNTGQKPSKAPAKPPPPAKAPYKAPDKAQLTLPLKTATPKRKKKKINQAEETKQFLTVLAVCALVFTFLLYLILMKSTR